MGQTLRIDLNCDIGESTGPQRMDAEERLLTHVTSANIACGFHAGNPELMRQAVRLARAHRVAIGAHPGFRDPEALGRREVASSPAEVENLVAYQVGALAGITALEGAQLSHVKPHGALYNMAAHDPELATAVARAVAAVDRHLILVGLAGSKLIETARTLGLTAAEEAFADRAYNPNGTLVPRDLPNAVIHDENEVVTRVLRLVRDSLVPAIDGQPVRIHADTICIHSDTTGADRLAQALRQSLTEAGVRIAAIGSTNA